MKIAVITGASSGLGREYAAQVVKQYDDLDEIWLIARRKDRLDAIAAAYPESRFRCLALDLMQRESLSLYEQTLTETNAQVMLLINNAGFGKLGDLKDSAATEQRDMVDLNCGALTEITARTLPFMPPQSGILNVCSIAAFTPTPRMTVYCSTKAYVYSFSKSLCEELRPHGINVLAVCPGPMRTEFLTVASITGNSKAFSTLPYCDPAEVAARSLERLRKGKHFYTNRFLYKLYRVVGKLVPHNLMMKFTKT